MPNLNASIVSNIPIALPEKSQLNAILEALDRLEDGMHAAANHRSATLRLKTQLIECYW
jgi:restriction endonuclease S subunit